jgi:hypothetical protein
MKTLNDNSCAYMIILLSLDTDLRNKTVENVKELETVKEIINTLTPSPYNWQDIYDDICNTMSNFSHMQKFLIQTMIIPCNKSLYS